MLLLVFLTLLTELLAKLLRLASCVRCGAAGGVVLAKVACGWLEECGVSGERGEDGVSEEGGTGREGGRGSGGEAENGGLGGPTGAPFLLFFLTMDPVDLLRLWIGLDKITGGLTGMGAGTMTVGGACLSSPNSIDIARPPSIKL